MQKNIDASESGSFSVGGDLEIHRLGFGAMRITGPGIWGEPEDLNEARQLLRRVPELGINFIDTADSYGPEVSERLLGEVFAGDQRVTIATKGGLTRSGPNAWHPVGRPEYLRQCVLMSLRRLKRERIDLWQLHRIDRNVPREEQFGVMAEMQKDGLIRHLGLSNVSVEEIEAAERYFRVRTVQNHYNLVFRKSEDVLDHCTKRGLGFIPWYPLAAGDLAKEEGGPLAHLAQARNVKPSQIALAWMLKRSPIMLPIPGTGKVAHLEENTAAAGIKLSDDDFASLDAQGKKAWEKPKSAA
jgi:aryl-alcohol dehydrogenase-like predicted oxidoreductase